MQDYLNPIIPKGLSTCKINLVKATTQSLAGYGTLISDYKNFNIEIVTWPKPTGRPIDEHTGNEAGTKKGIFEFVWQGDMFFGKNNAVNSEYLLGWSKNPEVPIQGEIPEEVPCSILLWHANYHPDGGQLFFPLDNSPFVVPLALPGDDITPDKFVAFYFEGNEGLYIHPNVWHEGIFPLVPKANFYDEQGAVHARVSVNFADEFGLLLEVPLRKV